LTSLLHDLIQQAMELIWDKNANTPCNIRLNLFYPEFDQVIHELDSLPRRGTTRLHKLYRTKLSLDADVPIGAREVIDEVWVIVPTFARPPNDCIPMNGGNPKVEVLPSNWRDE
jgi:hypothetical protein